MEPRFGGVLRRFSKMISGRFGSSIHLLKGTFNAVASAVWLVAVIKTKSVEHDQERPWIFDEELA